MPIETAPPADAKCAAIVRFPSLAGSEAFAEAVRQGLTARPKTLPCRYFYDADGSQLFERICALPEYYLTRTEDAILRDYCSAMVAGWDQPPTLLELGSGSSSKTRRLIAAALARYGTLHYIPIDVSTTVLEEAAETLARAFPALRVTGYAADYRGGLVSLAERIDGPKCLLFLGSSLGNYEAGEAVDLLKHVARSMRPDDRLLLGTDMVKDTAVLEAAYDDAQGVTAEFNRNLLRRINRELGANFEPEAFAHKALYRRHRARIEIHLVSRSEQLVQVPGASLTIRFRAGETIHTENSHKYTVATLRELAERSGFLEESAWTDPEGWFRVQRWRLHS